MGNYLFSDINGLFGGQSSLYSTTLPLPGFDPTNVPSVTDPACIDVFDKGGLGVGYSSIAIRIPALLDLAISDEHYKEDNITALDALGCFNETSNVLRCDWNLVYNRIVTECQVANLRGAVDSNINASGEFIGLLEGNCEELLGITPEMIKDGTLDPKKEWCPAYYDGQEGEPTLASIVVMRDNFPEGDDDYWNDLTEKTLGLDSDLNTFIFENVPYCTAFDSCTDEDFFTMVNAEAAVYAESSPNEIKIIPKDKKSTKPKKSKKSNKKRRKMRVL